MEPSGGSRISLVGVWCDPPDAAQRAVVSRASEGDGAAFAEIYVQYFHPIYKYLVKALGNVDDAQDGAQEVFRKALEAMGDYQDRGGSIRSWLFQMAHNQAVDQLRRGRGIDVTAPVELTIAQDLVAAKAIDVTVGLEPRGGIAGLIAELPDTQQRVLSLRYVFEMTATEIGDVIGASADSVRHLQQRALRSLASSMEAAPLMTTPAELAVQEH
jgi:RNA polymerase sigma-70 factor (ECF subfamily)